MSPWRCVSASSCYVLYKNMHEHAGICNVNTNQTKGCCDFMYWGAVQNRRLTDCGHLRLQFSSVCTYCNMFCFAHHFFGLPIWSTVWKHSMMVVMSESMKVTWTVSVYFWWCSCWFAPFFSCSLYSWYLSVAAWKGNVKISFTQPDIVWLEW